MSDREPYYCPACKKVTDHVAGLMGGLTPCVECGVVLYCPWNFPAKPSTVMASAMSAPRGESSRRQRSSGGRGRGVSRACEDPECGEDIPVNQRRARCPQCGLLVCGWCWTHVHALAGTRVDESLIPGHNDRPSGIGDDE